MHTGWAACVVARGSLRAPVIDAREELELLGDPERFLYHRAADGRRADAERSIARAKETAKARAVAALERIIERARGAGHGPIGCTIVATTRVTPASLDDILSAHARIHAAEGCFYRDVLRKAADACGLATRIISPKELDAVAAGALGLKAPEVAKLVASAGRAVGRPWGKDQKMASLGAWIALA